MKRTTILMTAFLCLFGLTESPAQNTHKNMELLNLTQECIIRKTKCFDFWERNVLFPKTKRSFFRTPTLPFSA